MCLLQALSAPLLGTLSTKKNSACNLKPSKKDGTGIPSHTQWKETNWMNRGGADDQCWLLTGDYYYVQAFWPYNSHCGSQHQRLRALQLEWRMCSQCQELGLELELAVCGGCPACLPVHCKFSALLQLQTNWTNLTAAVSCKKENRKVLRISSEYMHLQVFPCIQYKVPNQRLKLFGNSCGQKAIPPTILFP